MCESFPIFIVRQLPPDNESLTPTQEENAKNRVLWMIVADPKTQTTASTEKIQTIEYGEVPTGFIQEVPSQGSPEQLQENQTYEAVGPFEFDEQCSGSLQNHPGKSRHRCRTLI